MEDYDDVIRDTIEQGSLASYSKTYKKKPKASDQVSIKDIKSNYGDIMDDILKPKKAKK